MWSASDHLALVQETTKGDGAAGIMNGKHEALKTDI
jgi:hypothetical protein